MRGPQGKQWYTQGGSEPARGEQQWPVGGVVPALRGKTALPAGKARVTFWAAVSAKGIVLAAQVLFF